MKKFICQLFGHKYILKRRITEHIREVVCTRCKVEFGIHDEEKVGFPMDDELRRAYEYLLSARNYIKDHDKPRHIQETDGRRPRY